MKENACVSKSFEFAVRIVNLYWLNLLHRTAYINDTQFESINQDVDELLSILMAICKNVAK